MFHYPIANDLTIEFYIDKRFFDHLILILTQFKSSFPNFLSRFYLLGFKLE